MRPKTEQQKTTKVILSLFQALYDAGERPNPTELEIMSLADFVAKIAGPHEIYFEHKPEED